MLTAVLYHLLMIEIRAATSRTHAVMVFRQGDLLIDGGYLNNMPVDVMHAMGERNDQDAIRCLFERIPASSMT